jgi:hypothetical protein
MLSAEKKGRRKEGKSEMRWGRLKRKGVREKVGNVTRDRVKSKREGN